ncbi:MAG: GlmU family protein [Ignavibacteriaceae bacterium]|jgi:UDP-N-acetylglucosamine diphosphorylase/glucosamine-1-phosphate N-acetyltransferase
MQICIFEDKNYINLEPLIYSRPVYQLVCGILTLREKILRSFPGKKYSLHCRAYLHDVLQREFPQIPVNKLTDNECLFINGRILSDKNLAKLFLTKEDRLFVSGGTIAAAKLSGDQLKAFSENFPDVLSLEDFYGLPVQEVDIEFVNYIWDLINNNGLELKRDFDYLSGKGRAVKKGPRRKIHEGVHFINNKQIFIGDGVEIKPGCVIDASGGPVYIDKEAYLYPNVVIMGPAYIGAKTKIKSGATIYGNVSIGKVCKVGGEVEGMIMMSYSNKQHAGYIGHAFLGSWVNLGADTNNSDLKNNYSTIKVAVNGKEINSGMQFLGLIMGDHSKTAINTMFNTGTVVGFSSNVFGAGFPSKEIPSFSWGGSEGMMNYNVEKSIDTAEKVLGRRNVQMSEADKKLFMDIYEMTEDARMRKGY